MEKRLLLILLWFGTMSVGAGFLQAQSFDLGIRATPQLTLTDFDREKGYAAGLEGLFGWHPCPRIGLEGGLGLRHMTVRHLLIDNTDQIPGDGLAVQSTGMLTVPARLRLGIHRPDAIRRLWLDLGFTLGLPLTESVRWEGEGWENPEPYMHYPGQKTWKFIDVGLEVDVPLAENHRIGFGLNYQAHPLTSGGRSMRAWLHLPGFSIRISRSWK